MHFEIALNATQVRNLIRTLGLEDGDKETIESNQDGQTVSGILGSDSDGGGNRLLSSNRRHNSKRPI
jgi:hypothetical protein